MTDQTSENYGNSNLLKYVRFPIHQTTEWLEAYKQWYINLSNKKLFSFYSCIDNKTIGAIPLQLTTNKHFRFLNQRRLEIFGKGPTDFFQPLIDPSFSNIVINDFSNWLVKNKKKWDIIVLSEIPKSWDGLDSLIDGLESKGFKPSISVHNGFYYVDTSKSWEDYYEQFIKVNNKDLLKDLRQLDRRKITLSLESHRQNVHQKLLTVLDLYAQRRNTLGQVNSYETEQRKEFVRSVINAYESRGWVEISFLKDDLGNIWAFQLDWLMDGIRYHWNHAYNEQFKKYSPGKLLLFKLMERAFLTPNEIQCNHMRGKAEYKQKLANEAEELIEIKIENVFSLRNKIIKIITRFLQIIKFKH